MYSPTKAGLLVLLICIGSCSTGDAFSFREPHLWPWHGRRLQQQAAPAAPKQQQQQQRGARSSATVDFPMCMWNDVKEYCTPSHMVYLSLDAPPSTLVHRAATLAYDRNLVCNGRLQEAACIKDKANRCFFWNKSCVGLDAYELVNWLGAGNQVNGDAALLAFTCPGTEAAQYKACKTATDAGPKGICNQLPGCTFVPLAKECLPKAFDSKSLPEVQALAKAYSAFNATAWGSCAGACYVKQASICQQSYNSSSACQAKPFCVWEYDVYDGRKVCLHRETAARATDDFSKQFAAVKDACAKLKGPVPCEEPKIVTKNVGKFRSKKQEPLVAAEAGVKCVT